jgi:hypothetical protein
MGFEETRQETFQADDHVSSNGISSSQAWSIVETVGPSERNIVGTSDGQWKRTRHAGTSDVPLECIHLLTVGGPTESLSSGFH